MKSLRLKENKLFEIQEKLREKGIKSCVSCSNETHNLIPYFLLKKGYVPLKNPSDLYYTGSSTPTIAVFCDNCGHITEYSALILGVLDSEDNE